MSQERRGGKAIAKFGGPAMDVDPNEGRALGRQKRGRLKTDVSHDLS